MFIDLVFVILLVMAVIKGISKGLIVAVFSLLAFIIGLAAALKLSATVADHLRQSLHVNGYFLPLLSFLLVFVAVVFIVRHVASLIKKAAGVLFLGWIDSLGGVLLYMLLYTLIYSVFLFFATRIHVVPAQTRASSLTYSYIEPLGPEVMSALGKVIPFFSHMFADLGKFFETVSAKSHE